MQTAPPPVSGFSQPPADGSRLSSRRSWRIPKAILFTLLLAVSAWLVILGLQLRDWTWRTAEPIRWNNIDNAWRWGSEVLSDGNGLQAGAVSPGVLLSHCFHFYERAQQEHSLRRDRLDYPPLRLLLVAAWVNYVHLRDPQALEWSPEYAGPMLALNSACSLAAAAFTLLLVQHWVSRRHLRASRGGWATLWQRLRCQEPAAPVADFPLDRASPWESWSLALLAALLVWFNPAVILESHGWPQWDIWPVPFFLLSLLLASRNHWLTAGGVMALGALLKGQLLIVAPVLFFWPLFAGNLQLLLRALLGFAAAAAVCVSPWLLRGQQAWCVALGTPLLAALWPLLRRRWRVACATALCGVVLGVLVGAWAGQYSMAWWEVGILTGTTKFPMMARNCAANLPAILARVGGWELRDVVFSLGAWQLEMKQLLVLLYAAGLLACGWGAARLDRRHDPRALVALTAPWVLMFAFLGQMDGRYLLYGACASAVFVAAGWHLGFLCLLLTAINFASMCKFLLQKRPDAFPVAWRCVSPLEPGAGWALLIAAGIILYLATVPGRTLRRLPADAYS